MIDNVLDGVVACSDVFRIYICKDSFVRPMRLWTQYFSAHGVRTWKYVQYEEKESVERAPPRWVSWRLAAAR